jgi:hypothetical protein
MTSVLACSQALSLGCGIFGVWHGGMHGGGVLRNCTTRPGSRARRDDFN